MNPQEFIFNIKVVALWEKMKGSDEKAFSSLMAIFSSLLYRYRVRIIRDGEFIEECIQNLFFDLRDKRKSIKSTGSVKFYLF